MTNDVKIIKQFTNITGPVSREYLKDREDMNYEVGFNLCGDTQTRYAVGKIQFNPDKNPMHDLLVELGNQEVRLIDYWDNRHTRLEKIIYDEKGEFGAFKINQFYQTLAVMRGRISNSIDLVYVVARDGDLYKVAYINGGHCESGALGDTTEFYRMNLQSIEGGVLKYVEAKRTEFDRSKGTTLFNDEIPSATKIEDFEKTYKIRPIEREKIENIIAGKTEWKIKKEHTKGGIWS